MIGRFVSGDRYDIPLNVSVRDCGHFTFGCHGAQVGRDVFDCVKGWVFSNTSKSEGTLSPIYAEMSKVSVG